MITSVQFTQKPNILKMICILAIFLKIFWSNNTQNKKYENKKYI